jgi:hypothetical protein
VVGQPRDRQRVGRVVVQEQLAACGIVRVGYAVAGEMRDGVRREFLTPPRLSTRTSQRRRPTGC